jgi:2-(1,2-epoxy-1,2-dihydrophenyl)acetyl-CoA isomerase
MADELLLVRKDGGAHVTFNRPEVRNALTPTMLLDLATFLDEIARDPAVRYLVFRGAGDHFIAGGDVVSYRDSLALSPAERRLYFERRVRANAETFLILESLQIPVIVAVRGAVAGAGLSFVLAADFCLATEDSLFIIAQPTIGLPLDLGLSYFLPRVVGAKQARKLALTTARIGAAEAERLGIVDGIFARDALEDGITALLKRLAAGAPKALGRSRALLAASERNTLLEQMELEVRSVGACVAEPDFIEGVTAFLEKRKPAFQV